MPKHRFHCPQLAVGRVALDPQESRHAVDVLRLRAGAVLELFDGSGREAEGTLATANRTGCVCEVATVREAARRVGLNLTLCTALPRAARQQYLFEKCCELGVARIVPTVYERSVVKPKKAAAAKWRQWTVEAGKQCGCLYLPTVDDPASFKDTLAMCDAGAVLLFGETTDKAKPIAAALDAVAPDRLVWFWVGPEGGLTEQESRVLADAGAEAVSLGPHVLRIETACVAIAALAISRARESV